jgi:hypothetical protein
MTERNFVLRHFAQLRFVLALESYTGGAWTLDF